MFLAWTLTTEHPLSKAAWTLLVMLTDNFFWHDTRTNAMQCIRLGLMGSVLRHL